MQLGERFQILRVTADTGDRPGHCAVSLCERRGKERRGGEGNVVEKGGKRRGASKRKERQGVKRRWVVKTMW